MTLETQIEARLIELINQAEELKVGDPEHGIAISSDQVAKCTGWLASALSLVERICEGKSSAYIDQFRRITDKEYGWIIKKV